MGLGGGRASQGPGAQEEGAASAATLERLRRRFLLYFSPEVVVGVDGGWERRGRWSSV